MADQNNNPWGKKPGDGNRNPWGSGGGSGGNGGGFGGGSGPTPPDLDDLLRKAQENLRRSLPGGAGPGRLAGLGLLAVVGLWLASGFYFVNPAENAVITQFGKWVKTQDTPGLGYRLPWPVQEASIINVTGDRRIQIGFVEAGTRGGPAAKRDIPEESLMLTADANIVDLDMTVLWNISDARNYLFNIMDPEQTIKKVAESAIREVVGQSNLQPIITGDRAIVANRALKIMQETLDGYQAGVAIKEVVINAATVHPDVLEAFEDVVAALQDAERFQNEANIYANDIVPKARGEAIKITQSAEAYKESTIAKASGDADRFNSIYAAYVDGKDVTKTRLYLEAMEDVLKNAEKIIIDGGAAGTGGVVPYLPLNELRPAAGTPAPVTGGQTPPPGSLSGFGTRDQQ